MGPFVRVLPGTAIAALVSLAACAGAEPTSDGQALGLGGADSGTTSGLGGGQDDGKPDDPDADGSGGAPSPPDLGPCDGDADCVLQDGFCFEAYGTCLDGMCHHPPEVAGVICDDGDPCTTDEVCDGAGTCGGVAVPCAFDNANPGSCNGGVCMGMTCQAGWGDCDNQWSNGCETPLNSQADCGACGEPCIAGAHASANCSSGSCELDCTAPYEDCDGDPSNGCEIPTEVANQCSAGGLDPSGCWTAHCGNSAASGAVNFGTWFCFECTTCHVPAAGQCQWCDHGSGTWYTQEACACGTFEDLVCAP